MEKCYSRWKWENGWLNKQLYERLHTKRCEELRIQQGHIQKVLWHENNEEEVARHGFYLKNKKYI